MDITANNIADYLFSQTDIFDKTVPLEVSELSAENADTEIDGFINFIFRVSQNGKSYIVKQARNYLLKGGIVDNLPVERNYFEYISFILRDGISKGHTPKMCFVDTKNNVFMMEDLRSETVKVMRFQLNEGKEFFNFPNQIGDFLAKNHFYTSELYLSKDVFRDLQRKFENLPMRAIMEDIVLLRHEKSANGTPLSNIGEQVWKNPELRLALVEVRDNLIKKSECLVHGDLHTSNLFVDVYNLFVIDMEYSFVAPFSYDIGYLLANFISQYAAFTFNPKFTKEKRNSYQIYLLNTVEQVINAYFSCFSTCFYKDAKPLYRDTKGYLDSLFINILQETLGVMAAANVFRIINLAPFPDFDCILDDKSKILAQGLSVAIDEYLLLNRKSIYSPKAAVNGIMLASRSFLDSARRNMA